MYIRQTLHTESDLAMRVSRRFLKRWKRLLRQYEKRRWRLSKAVALRCVNVAWVVFSGVAEGKADVPMLLSIALCEKREMIEYEGVPMQLGDASIEEQLIWDSLCLMLEEIDPLPEYQYAFDLACPHASLAYDEHVLEDDIEEAEIVHETTEHFFAVQTSTMDERVSEQLYVIKQVKREIELVRGKVQEERKRVADYLSRLVVEYGVVLPEDVRYALLHLDDERVLAPNIYVEGDLTLGDNTQVNDVIENGGKKIVKYIKSRYGSKRKRNDKR